MKINKIKMQVIVHKFNNRLTNIGLSTELVIKEIYGPINTKQKKQLMVVLSEVKKMKNLLKTLN